MRAILIKPDGKKDGQLSWLGTYLYPQKDLEDAIASLKDKDYDIDYDEENALISFTSDHKFDKVQIDWALAFPWMDISFHENECDINHQNEILDYCLIILPVSRLEIDTSIITESICLFPPGVFNIERVEIKTLDGKIFKSETTSSLRDSITNTTEISAEVFNNLPLLVFDKVLPFEDFKQMTHQDDVQLIRECSNYGDKVMDLLRYYNGDFNVPEALPSRPGVWFDRYSAILTYFPAGNVANVQAREVELKVFSKGIGMQPSMLDQLGFHILLDRESTDMQNITKHALRLNSAILESDNETMKFTQIMMFLDFIGNPFSYGGGFKEIKKHFIPCLTTDLDEYERISDRIKVLTGGEHNTNPGFRTKIVHMGKTIEELIPQLSERRKLFKELNGYVYDLIRHMIHSEANTWDEYEVERKNLRKQIFP